MNRKLILWSILFFAVGFVFLAPSRLPAKNNKNEGKAWLAAHTDPPEINVDGVWESADWGEIILHQKEGAREITGTSDKNYEIEGVASGKQVFLVFSFGSKWVHTAQVSLREDGKLVGSYLEGILQPDSKSEAIEMSKRESTKTGAAAQQESTSGEPAHVVVYREHYHNCPHVKASVYVDGKEAANIQNGRYLTLTLPPGKHLIGTSKIGRLGNQTEELDLAPAATSYVHFNFHSAWVCTIYIDKVDSASAQRAIAKLKPNDAKNVKMPETVSVAPIGNK